MPYSSTDELPARAKKLSAKKQRQFMHVFNSAVKRGESESSAFAQAYGVANKELSLEVEEKGWVDSWDFQQHQLDQTVANYRNVGDAPDLCADCQFFISSGSACNIVSGDIQPTGTCDYFLKEEPYEQQPIPVYIVKSIKEAVADGFESIKQMFVPSKPEDRVFFTTKDANGNTRWFSIVSGKYKDRDREILRDAAHKEYVEWATASGVYPELWLWHCKNSRIGQTDWLDYTDNGLLCASGTVDPEYENIVQALSKEVLGVSHGFVHPPIQDGVYDWYRTWEISILPKERASFAFSDWSNESMAFTKEKRDWLTKLGVPEDHIKAWETKEIDTAAKLAELNIDFKADEELPPPANDDTSPSIDFTPVVAGLTKLTEMIGELATQQKATQADVKALQATDDEKVAAHMISEQAKLKEGFQASSNKDTVTGEQEAAAADLSWFEEAVFGAVAKVKEVSQ